MSNRVGGEERNIFGGVIFTRADRDDIRTLGDLTRRSFAAVDRTSLGGFQMAWAELSRVGIDPYEDFARLTFAGIHDAVVLTVRGGEIDAGTVRTDILERMLRTQFSTFRPLTRANSAAGVDRLGSFPENPRSTGVRDRSRHPRSEA